MSSEARFKIVSRLLTDFYPPLFLNPNREILSSFHHIESQEVIILGKGLGGYLSTLVLAKDEQKTFKCGIAISPIIDWFRHGMVKVFR